MGFRCLRLGRVVGILMLSSCSAYWGKNGLPISLSHFFKPQLPTSYNMISFINNNKNQPHPWLLLVKKKLYVAWILGHFVKILLLSGSLNFTIIINYDYIIFIMCMYTWCVCLYVPQGTCESPWAVLKLDPFHPPLQLGIDLRSLDLLCCLGSPFFLGLWFKKNLRQKLWKRISG